MSKTIEEIIEQIDELSDEEIEADAPGKAFAAAPTHIQRTNQENCKLIIQRGKVVGASIPLTLLKNQIGLIPHPKNLIGNKELQLRIAYVIAENLSECNEHGEVQAVNVTPEIPPDNNIGPSPKQITNIWLWESVNLGYQSDTSSFADNMEPLDQHGTIELDDETLDGQNPDHYHPLTRFYVFWNIPIQD